MILRAFTDGRGGEAGCGKGFPPVTIGALSAGPGDVKTDGVVRPEICSLMVKIL